MLVLVDSRYPSWSWYWRYVISTLRADLASGQLKEKLLARFNGAIDRAIERRKFQIGRLYLRRTLKYSPKPFAGEIVLIASEELRSRNPTRVWKTLTPYPVTVHLVPGDHFSHLRQHAVETAAALDKCLAEADATLSGSATDIAPTVDPGDERDILPFTRTALQPCRPRPSRFRRFH